MPALFFLQQMENTWKKLEQVLGVSFRDRNLLMTAVTHTSYANEHRQEEARHNERLEYLGDAVLELVSSEYLYSSYPDKGEGELSRLRASMVCEPSLAKCARDLTLPAFLRLGKGEESMGGRTRDSIISDALEAVIGAIYLDRGFEEAKHFILEHVLLDLKEEDLFLDSKTRLQELVQENGNTPVYEVLREDGPDHDRKFTVAVLVKGEILGTGTGRTKKAAAQNAAKEAIANYVSEIH